MYIQQCKSCKYGIQTELTINCALNPFKCIVDGKYLFYKEREENENRSNIFK